MDCAVKLLIGSKPILNENKKRILEFRQHCVASGLSVARQLYYLQRLTRIAERLGEKRFEDCGRADIQVLMEHVNTAKTESGKPWSGWNKAAYALTIKKFWRWLKQVEDSDEDPPETSWIKIRWPTDSQILPEDILTCEDILAMLKTAKKRGTMWWAMIATADDKALRPEEWMTLTISQIQFDDYGDVSTVKSGKVGERRVRLVSSSPALREWLSIHPDSNNPKGPVWIYLKGPRKGERLSYDAIRSAIRSIARESNVKKRVNPYSFRHSSITRSSTKLTEPVMRKLYGWSASSHMPARYIHLSGRDVDDEVLNMHGITRGPNEEKVLNPIRCRRCELLNSPEARFCSRCSAPLDELSIETLDQKSRKADEVMAALLRDPEVQSVIARKIRELGLASKLLDGQAE